MNKKKRKPYKKKISSRERCGDIFYISSSVAKYKGLAVIRKNFLLKKLTANISSNILKNV